MWREISPPHWCWGEIARGNTVSLPAIKGEPWSAVTPLVRDRHSWSQHVGEIPTVVSQDARGQGDGRALSQETFALALGAALEKLSVQMTSTKGGAITLFEGLGFKADALLRDHVRGVDRKTHDIVVLGHRWRKSWHSWRLLARGTIVSAPNIQP